MPKHKAQQIGNKMLPSVVILQEFKFLFMPPQSENVYELKRNDQQQKHQALCLG